jgi:hypothetical protein
VVRWKIYTPLLIREQLKIAAKGHSLFVVMKKAWDFWRGGSVCTQKFLLFVLSR